MAIMIILGLVGSMVAGYFAANYLTSDAGTSMQADLFNMPSDNNTETATDTLGIGAMIAAFFDQLIYDFVTSDVVQILMLIAGVWIIYKIYKMFKGGTK